MNNEQLMYLSQVKFEMLPVKTIALLIDTGLKDDPDTLKEVYRKYYCCNKGTSRAASVRRITGLKVCARMLKWTIELWFERIAMLKLVSTSLPVGDVAELVMGYCDNATPRS